jgi:hypothetical protein
MIESNLWFRGISHGDKTRTSEPTWKQDRGVEFEVRRNGESAEHLKHEPRSAVSRRLLWDGVASALV